MNFLKSRETLMEYFSWDCQMATLAYRIAMEIETFDDIAATPSLGGIPILGFQEYMTIKNNTHLIRRLIC